MDIKQTIARVAPSSLIRGFRYIVDQDYRRKRSELTRIRSLARYEPTVVTFMKHPIEIPSGPSFLDMYDEIFEREVYRFETAHDVPHIIDGGANVGLSIIYFKHLYPKCKVVAFEADPDIFAILKRNIERWGFEDVELHCCALWSCETTLSFMSEGSYAGRVAIDNEAQGKLIPAVSLRTFLALPVSFLKLDIEGAETEVLQDCATLLGNAENIFIEYHSFPNVPQTLDQVLHLLSNSGFRVHFHTHSHSPRPFIQRTLAYGMDMQVNIYAFR